MPVIYEHPDNFQPAEVIDVPGYRHVKWGEVTEGDVVYLQGRAYTEPFAYGPHMVVSPSARILKNSKGVQFIQYPEDLMVLEEKGE